MNRVYDGTTAATVTLHDDRVAGDDLTVTDSATFADKNVGTAKTVSVSGIPVSGSDASNYSVQHDHNDDSGHHGPDADGERDRCEQGLRRTTTATVTLSDDRVAGDVFTDSYATATFANKNVGTGKTVSVSGMSISGTDAGNYTFNTTASTTADITARALTVTATGVNKRYDGNTTATVTLADNRLSGDVFTDSYTSATFANKNVGTLKTVTVSGISISGADAGNYSVNTTTSTTATITARSLHVTATGVNKVYDGTLSALVILGDDRVSGDVLTVSDSAMFANKNVGSGKPVAVSGIVISAGADAGNYIPGEHNCTTTADIIAAAVDGDGDRRQQGLRRHHRGDGHIDGRPRARGRRDGCLHHRHVRGQESGAGKSGERQRHFDLGHGRRQLHVQTPRPRPRRTSRAAADGERDGRQQGLRRHDDGDRDAVRRSRRGRRVHWTATPPRRLRDKNVGTGKTVSVSGISIIGNRRGQLHVQHHGVDDGQHHAAIAARDRHRGEQGVRRHDSGDGDLPRRPGGGRLR